MNRIMRVTIIHGHMNCIGRTVMMVDEFENSVHTYTINISLFFTNICRVYDFDTRIILRFSIVIIIFKSMWSYKKANTILD